ncbi:DUF4190 domain-containing protein [Microcella sp.]|uniref:DUF4190 domain-containing protein n=1 Tax=Microcella sp. TaxID=1913979 RepID=UPI00260C5B6D|nr:DUF4190 domain-containing protein [Microcella sp.]
MDTRTATGLIFIGVLVVLGAILVVRARALREKEYRSWLDSYHAATAQPETDPARLRERWTAELRARNAPRRTVAFAQNHTLVAATGGGGVQPPPPIIEPRTNTLALLSFIFCLLGGLLGIVFGHIALAQIRRTGENGRGLAIAGLVLGYSWLGFFLAFFIVTLAITIMR